MMLYTPEDEIDDLMNGTVDDAGVGLSVKDSIATWSSVASFLSILTDATPPIPSPYTINFPSGVNSLTILTVGKYIRGKRAI